MQYSPVFWVQLGLSCLAFLLMVFWLANPRRRGGWSWMVVAATVLVAVSILLRALSAAGAF